MKKLYFEMNSGISGDMFLSLLGQFVGDLDKINKTLSDFLGAEVSISLEDVAVNGILCKRAVIKISKFPHIHRTFKDISKLIENSCLNENVKGNAIDIFKIIAEAEAKIHGSSIENVHFHEVGGVDSIIDIVGGCLLFDQIKVDKIVSSPFKLGSGIVSSMHGIIPVPAPATLEIIKGLPFEKISLKHELTTPTGGALIKYFTDEFSENIKGAISQTFYATGSKAFDTYPNITRLYKIEEHQDHNKIYEVSANIDDMPGEFFTPLMEKLFETGCYDVFFTPIIMKKNRPAYKVSVICREDILQKAKEILLKESSTFGVRYYEVKREILDRKFEETEVLGEIIRFKKGFSENFTKYSPEFEDIYKLSQKVKIPPFEIYKMALCKIYGDKS